MNKEEFEKRSKGQFYTPLPYVKLATEYMRKVWGSDFERRHTVWDMCAGTGNLFYYFDYMGNSFLSTLDGEECNYMRERYGDSGATIWQYDYLKDDVDCTFRKTNLLRSLKIPDSFKKVISDREDFSELIIFINPPYSAHGAGINSGVSKQGVEETRIKKCMHEYGRSKMDLCNQFLFRIFKEFPGCKLAFFSPIKYINASVDEDFRKNIFIGKFKGGFIFPMSEFEGIVSQAPVSFAMYDTSEKYKLENQNLIFDIYSGPNKNIGKKRVISVSKTDLMTHDVGNKRKKKKDVPPLKNAITIGNNIYLDKIDHDAFGFFHCKSNNVQSACQKTAFFSTAFSQGGGVSINANNFEYLMTLHAVRRIPTHTWMNAQDQFLKADYDEEFQNDCLVWSLFSSKNLSSSFTTKYKEKNYYIHNEFYPFVRSDKTYTIVGSILKSKKLSKEAQEVKDMAEIIYTAFNILYNDLDKDKWKIENYYSGWYQIRKSLEEKCPDLECINQFKIKYKILNDKIKNNIYNFGFLIKEEIL